MPKRVSRKTGKQIGRVYMGVDPGKAGGFAFVTDGGILVGYDPMPDSELDLWNYLKGKKGVHKAYIEKVSAMPGQGVTSMFTFGQGYGMLRMAIIAAGIPMLEVLPREWQREFGLVKTKKENNKAKHKEKIRAKCQQLFPDEDAWRRTLTYQRSVCDAIMIAVYAQQREAMRTHK